MTTSTTPRIALPQKTQTAPRAKRVRRGRLVRRIVLGAILLLLVLGLAAAFRPRPLGVEVTRAARGDIVVTVEEMARTRVRDRYVVSAPIAGTLVRPELHPGAPVEADAVLARIVPMEPMLLDPRSRLEAQARAAAAAAAQGQARAAITRAEIAEAHARDELERTTTLVKSGSLPADALTRAQLEARLRKEELASATFAEQMAANEAMMARAALVRFDPGRSSQSAFDMTSPVKGRVLRVLRESAGPVQPGTPIVELGDPAALEIVADVLSADAVRIEPKASVTIERWGGPPLAARVRTVEPSAFTRLSALGVEEQRVPVIIDLEEPIERWAALGDGFRVEVRIVTAEKKDVVNVPLASVFRHGQGWAVYVAQNDRAVLTPVRLGVRSDVAVEVEEGIGEGAVVLVHPSERVVDGARIAARSSQ